MRALCLIMICLGSLVCMGQATSNVDSTAEPIYWRDTALTISKQLDEVEVIQQRTSGLVNVQGRRMYVDLDDQVDMPKFLGTSDPMRFMQSFAGIQTNDEVNTGIHIQGCDDYHSLISINGAPVYYPNHLFGLCSTVISEHFSRMVLEQSEHTGIMDNHIGGWIDFETHHQQPNRFGLKGNVGLINSDLTLTIPCGKKSALWVSARTSYIDLLYGKLLNFNGLSLGYHFVDCNVTYAIHPTEKDEIVISGFYSRDNMNVDVVDSSNIYVRWQNAVGSIYWQRQLQGGSFRSTLSFSGFNNRIHVGIINGQVMTDSKFASANLKNKLSLRLRDDMMFNASLDYVHYFNYPLEFSVKDLPVVVPTQQSWKHAEEVSLGADLQHHVCNWFAYNAGIHGQVFYNNCAFGGLDPRVSVHFYPSAHHEISAHIGCYSQFYHKAGLANGGLPADFFFLADSTFAPEQAHAVNLRYEGSFLNDKVKLQIEGYYKQIFGAVESMGNILQLVNTGFHYEKYLLHGRGRNYGLNVMLQKTQGVLTGYISYSLGWAKRMFPELDGINDYIYSASHERRHDLNIVLNTNFAKRWHIGGQFVLASGSPYTEAKEAYLLNGDMLCFFSTYNGAHLPLYNRLDLSCSCDIIKKKESELGINISLYNVYCAKNVQFIAYKDNLRPIYGTLLSTIIPSISIYGTF